MEPDDIDDLARRAKAGDRDALEALLAAVRPRTLAICRGVLPYTSDAEDACQEALLNVATKIGSWGQQGRFTTWLHVVAVNSARSTYRRMKNQAVASEYSRWRSPTPARPASSPAPASTSSTRWRTSSRTTRSTSSRCCCGTSTACRTTRSPQLVGAPLGTVKAQIHHGRKIVRPMLRGDG